LDSIKVTDSSSCVMISRHSDANFEGCMVSSSKCATGFSIHDYSRPTIKSCEISQNRW
jgi:parallel beta-helix repeat protein